MEEYLNRLERPVIEIGGPTLQGFKTINTRDLDEFFTSNLASLEQKVGDNVKTQTWRDHIGSAGEIDFQADGQQLPLASESIGGVLISAVPNDEKLNQKIIDEACRVLVDGGILILEANMPRDVLYALNKGLEPVKWERKLSNFFKPYLNIALRKKLCEKRSVF